ncbi:hypothetical protein [Polluticoccus soli]|uniref:hypothetical protein n=1 Tax=Polluticoccus soli TaxID=3034150 RepID=UPI0023E2F4E7|nr:hypothetical protein [Flavipsychrobacter sp. JY13-12]
MDNKQKIQGRVDWVFFIFLFLFTNQAVLSLKVAGLVFIYLLRPNFKFGLSQDRLPKFYLYIILLAAINLLVHVREFSSGYLAAFSVGSLLWLFAFLAYHQLKLHLERYGPEGVYETLKAFTLANVLFSFWQLGKIILITGKLNPYSGLPFPYGMSTGDNIFGFFMQNSYYNMMVSAMLGVYFIFKRNLLFSVLSVITLMLVFGNIGTIVFVASAGALLLTGIMNEVTSGQYGWLQRLSPPGSYKVYIPAMLLFVGVSYASLSPENFRYAVKKMQDKVFALKTTEKNNFRTMISADEPDTAVYNPFAPNAPEITEKIAKTEVTLKDLESQAKTAPEDKKLEAKKKLTEDYILRFKGKSLAMVEAFNYVKSSPPALMLGAGTARFSSLTAQKVAGFDSSRLFMNVLPHYRSPEYAENHMLIIEGRIKAHSKYFSNANWPDSFFAQLVSEYGLLGVITFLVFYVYYFVKRRKYWTYGFWLCIMIIPFAHMTYLFEPLCVMVFFELLMEADIKEQELKEQQQ